MTSPQNYLAPITPYEYKKNKSGQLIPDKKEMKVCRLVISLINNENYSLRAIPRELEKKNIKIRSDKILWGHALISSIYDRLNEKI